MNTNVPFGMAAPPPPPRPSCHATVRAIPNPAAVPASLPSTSSSSSRMNAARDRAQSWRGKYLRALNICPEDIEIARRNADKAAADGRPRVRALSFHRAADYVDGHLSLSRSYSSSTEKEDEQRKSLERSTRQQLPHHPQQHHIRAVPLRAPSTTLHRATSGTTVMTTTTTMTMPVAPSASNPYGFPMRPNMSRGRRCHTDPFELQDRVSAPIQIPSGPVGNNQLDGNARHHDAYASGGGVGARRRTSPQPALGDNDNGSGSRTDVRLLSWEEPVAMLAAGDALSKGWRLPHGGVMSAMELGVRRARRDEDEDDPSAHGMNDVARDDDDDDDTESHGGDIFAMDESEDEDADAAARDNQSMAGASGKSRRRYRTESMNVVSSGREKRTHHAFDDDVDVDFDRRRQELSQSFVPPHQMVDRRDCFSIGLRDELKKRRPTNHI